MTQREFVRDETLTAVAEVYVNKAGKAGPVTVATSVLDAGGRVYHEQVSPYDAQGGKGRVSHAHVATIPLTGLLPGLYTLRFDATMPGAKAPAARRELVFAVR